jgi:hypothetical protein
MSQQEHGLGALPLVFDDRDWSFASIPRERIEAFLEGDHEKWWAMHGQDFRINQGSEGTCTAHSVTNNFLDAPKPHYEFPDFETPEMAHQFARDAYLEFSGDTTYQQGAQTRDSLQWAIDHGYAAAYYRLWDVDDIIDALRMSPVVFASAWFNSMFSPRFPNWTSNAYLRVDAASGIAGYHQYLLNGFDLSPEFPAEDADTRPFVRMHNSWGPGWGKNGTARIFLDDLSVLPWWAYVLTETTF